MKKKKGFALQRLMKEYLVVGAGKDAINFNKVIRLNETSAFIWNAMGESDFTPQQLSDALRAEYDMDEATATSAVHKTTRLLLDAGVIEG